MTREQIAERLYRIACEPAMPGDPGHPADWPNAPDPLTQAYRRMAAAVLSLLSEARAEQERFVAGCRAALEEVGYTGSLDEAADKALERACAEARAEGARDAWSEAANIVGTGDSLESVRSRFDAAHAARIAR